MFKLLGILCIALGVGLFGWGFKRYMDAIIKIECDVCGKLCLPENMIEVEEGYVCNECGERM